MWLDGRTDAIVILGPRKSWLAYEGKPCCSRRYPKHTKEVKYVKSCPHHFRTPSSHWTASTTLSSSISEDRAPSGFDNLNSCRADKSFQAATTTTTTTTAADGSTATSTAPGAALEFDSDDNVPSGLLRWMKNQKSTPTCVTMGSNATYCAIGAGDYELSDNFRKDLDLVKFLDTAKTNQTLDGVVSLLSITATGTTLLKYCLRE
jgi:hypothetical protein